MFQLLSKKKASAAKTQAKDPNRKKQIREEYFLGKVLGRGHFAEVREAIHLKTRKAYAVKVIEKTFLKKDAKMRESEIKCLMQVSEHPHVISFVDSYEEQSHVYLVLEYCAGGDLFTQIADNGQYCERLTVRCCKQIAEALLHIHKCNVIHRDLKPENILLGACSSDAVNVKITDFGLSRVLGNENQFVNTVCGTWAYCAPEVISHKPYTQKVDNWTLGVIMYILLSGYHPFDPYGDAPEPQVLRNIISCNYEFDDPVWDSVNPEAMDLVRGLLTVDPDERLTLEQFLDSSWVQGKYASAIVNKEVGRRLSEYHENRQSIKHPPMPSSTKPPTTSTVAEEEKGT